jgi:hypothetical protein
MHMRLSDIYIRDPFILPVAAEGMYYLYGTNRGMWETTSPCGFWAYKSRDLDRWEGPFQVFMPPPGFWERPIFGHQRSKPGITSCWSALVGPRDSGASRSHCRQENPLASGERACIIVTGND